MSFRDEEDDLIRELLSGADDIDWSDVTSPDFVDEFERRQTGPVYSVPTPLSSWNRVCGDDGGGRGLARGWFVVIGGNPSHGKTLMALLLGRDAVRVGERTAFVSLEMHHAQLAARFYAMATGVEINRLEKGRFEGAALDEVRRALRVLFPNGGMVTNRGIVYSLGVLLRQMTSLAEGGVTVFLVDYLQLIGLGDEKEVLRQVSKAVVCLRAFAVKHQVLVVCLSQFNRETSANYDFPPQVQGLHGGGIIEACADEILLLDHSRYKPQGHRRARTWALNRKNKHGPRVEIPIEWDFSTLTIREAMPDEEDGWTDEESLVTNGRARTTSRSRSRR